MMSRSPAPNAGISVDRASSLRGASAFLGPSRRLPVEPPVTQLFAAHDRSTRFGFHRVDYPHSRAPAFEKVQMADGNDGLKNVLST
ncbi:hypothetical protein AWB67_07496 [Caballeronia terrestris]|uniref:Uncharacterized protein n=1 Tax=Caballeronia terrestris TaxID=1226301 RepID=A0A158L4W4_9BURK|nr:hypothetical protein AWB67_07496 [Caballeronia terrestris]